MASNTVKTSIYLPEEMLYALKERALKERITDTAAMQAAIESWLSVSAGPRSEDAPEKLTKRERELVDALVHLLRNPPKDDFQRHARDGIIEDIEAFRRLIA